MLFPRPFLNSHGDFYSFEYPFGEDWLAGAELRVYVFEPVGRVEIPLAVEDFRLSPRL